MIDPAAKPETYAIDRIVEALDNLTPIQRYAVQAWFVARYAPLALAEFAGAVEIPDRESS